MNKLIILISSLLFFPTLWASPLPQSKSEYCARFYEDADNQISIQDFANFPYLRRVYFTTIFFRLKTKKEVSKWAIARPCLKKGVPGFELVFKTLV